MFARRFACGIGRIIGFLWKQATIGLVSVCEENYLVWGEKILSISNGKTENYDSSVFYTHKWYLLMTSTHKPFFFIGTKLDTSSSPPFYRKLPWGRHGSCATCTIPLTRYQIRPQLSPSTDQSIYHVPLKLEKGMASCATCTIPTHPWSSPLTRYQIRPLSS